MRRPKYRRGGGRWVRRNSGLTPLSPGADVLIWDRFNTNGFLETAESGQDYIVAQFDPEVSNSEALFKSSGLVRCPDNLSPSQGGYAVVVFGEGIRTRYEAEVDLVSGGDVFLVMSWSNSIGEESVGVLFSEAGGVIQARTPTGYGNWDEGVISYDGDSMRYGVLVEEYDPGLWRIVLSADGSELATKSLPSGYNAHYLATFGFVINDQDQTRLDSINQVAGDAALHDIDVCEPLSDDYTSKPEGLLTNPMDSGHEYADLGGATIEEFSGTNLLVIGGGGSRLMAPPIRCCVGAFNVSVRSQEAVAPSVWLVHGTDPTDPETWDVAVAVSFLDGNLLVTNLLTESILFTEAVSFLAFATLKVNVNDDKTLLAVVWDPDSDGPTQYGSIPLPAEMEAADLYDIYVALTQPGFTNFGSACEVFPDVELWFDTTAPAPPSALVLTPGDGEFTIEWTNSPTSDVAGHEYQYKEGAGSFGAWTTATSPVVVTGRTNDTDYMVKVRAFDEIPNNSTEISDTVIPTDLVIDTLPFPYTSAGNGDDVLNGIGTLFGDQSFVNPIQMGVGMSASSWYGGTGGWPPYNATDHNNGTTWLLSNEIDGWIKYDFGPRRKLTLTDYGIRNRHDVAFWPRGWVLEGSNDDSAWTTIDSHTNEDHWSAAGVWVGFTGIIGAAAYRYLRVRFPDADSDGDNFNGISEIELYGNLQQVQLSAALPDEIDLTDLTGEGVINFLGTFEGGQAYTSPYQRGLIETFVTAWHNPTFTHFNLLDNSIVSEPWAPALDAGDYKLIYDLGPWRTLRVTDILVAPRYTAGTGGPKHFYLEGSNDNSTWDMLGEWEDLRIMERQGVNTPVKLPVAIETLPPYRYFRITLLTGYGYPVLNQFDLYGQFIENIPSPIGVRYISNRNTTLGAFADVLHNESVTPTSSGNAIGTPPNIIDGTVSEYFTNNAANSWIEFNFGSNTIKPEGFALLPRNGADHGIGNFVVEGWNGSSWDTIRTVTSANPLYKFNHLVNGSWAFWWVPGSTFYSRVRVRQTSATVAGDNFFGGLEMQMFGDYVV